MTSLRWSPPSFPRLGAVLPGRRGADAPAAMRPAPPAATAETSPDTALNQLSSEFREIPVRIVLSIFRSYLGELGDVAAATEATRRRITDACLVT